MRTHWCDNCRRVEILEPRGDNYNDESKRRFACRECGMCVAVLPDPDRHDLGSVLNRSIERICRKNDMEFRHYDDPIKNFDHMVRQFEGKVRDARSDGIEVIRGLLRFANDDFYSDTIPNEISPSEAGCSPEYLDAWFAAHRFCGTDNIPLEESDLKKTG